MAFNLRDAARMLGSYQHCVTVDEAIQQLENIRTLHGGDTLVMSQSWPVGEFRVYEDKEGEDGPPIVEVVLDMTLPAANGRVVE